MNYVEKCLIKFNGLPKDTKDVVAGNLAVKLVDEIESKYKIDVSFLIVLIAIGEIDFEEIVKYLILKNKIEQKEAEAISGLLLNDLFKKKKIDNFSREKEMVEEIKDIFKQSLVNILEADFDEIDDLNVKIIFFVSIGENLTEETLLKIMHKNEELLTSKKITIDGKLVVPTVGNWLKDVIKNLSADIFTNIDITKYLTASKNCTNLSQKERELVGKLLSLYKNLKFFPVSQTSDDPEKWEIIPNSNNIAESIKHQVPLSIPKTEEEKKIEKLEQEEKNFAGDGIEKKVIEEEIDREKRIEDLKFMASKFKEGSLEKKATEEEIKKLEEE